jgi:hypothetical protein
MPCSRHCDVIEVFCYRKDRKREAGRRALIGKHNQPVTLYTVHEAAFPSMSSATFWIWVLLGITSLSCHVLLLYWLELLLVRLFVKFFITVVTYKMPRLATECPFTAQVCTRLQFRVCSLSMQFNLPCTIAKYRSSVNSRRVQAFFTIKPLCAVTR